MRESFSFVIINFKLVINSWLGAQASRLQDCTRESQNIWGFNYGRNATIKNAFYKGYKRGLLGVWKQLYNKGFKRGLLGVLKRVFKSVEFDGFKTRRDFCQVYPGTELSEVNFWDKEGKA
ncbi:hypothetical protein PQO03_06740 [Lentisphaera profundi]|uniref:Uncharacterized protein n=1 Tax=Lentisphaera profundi TaxID=1658616 RepID=A0ABY7VTE5_9BACT|nr:hypothetical protein [Lentisphaera profundi]WDE95413.1 hypothetical protein PQO03_06740 [Lentisphaera profundi]